jgi:hypothetical protein
MFTIDGGGHLRQPPEVVFDFLADLRNENEWNPDVKNVRLVTGEPIGAGTAFEETVRGAGTMLIRHTGFERPRRLTLVCESPRIDMGFGFDFAAAEDGGTDFTVQAEVRPKGAVRIFEPLLAMAFRSSMKKRPAQMQAALDRRRGASG